MVVESLSSIEPSGEQIVSFRDNGAPDSSYERTPGGRPLARLLRPEIVLPTQYNAMVRQRMPDGGERRLLVAVLKDAVISYLKCMHGRSAHARHEFEETCLWFYAENQEGIFAYEILCETLGIHPEPLRRWLRSLQDDGGDSTPGASVEKSLGRRTFKRCVNPNGPAMRRTPLTQPHPAPQSSSCGCIIS